MLFIYLLGRDWRERSLLHLAVLYRRTDFVLQLIELCQELVNYQDCLGRTAFHYAICLPDNRRLFLKMVSKSGGIDKQIKDLVCFQIYCYSDILARYFYIIQFTKNYSVLHSLHQRLIVVRQPLETTMR